MGVGSLKGKLLFSFIKVTYVVGILFLLLSLLSLKSREVFKKIILKFALRDKKLTKGERILIELSGWISYFFSLLFLNLAVAQFGLPSRFQEIVNLIFFILYALIFTFISIKLSDFLLEKVSDKVKKSVSVNEAPLIDTYYSMISKIVNVFIVLIALIAVLDRLGVNVSSLVASLGVGSLAIGLAAKDTIRNFISGILLVTDRQFRIGDRVHIKDIGVEGYVYDIGLRTTRILTISGHNLITIPNSKLTEGIIENALYPDLKVKDFVEVGVSYSSDISKVKSLLLEAVSSVEGIMKDPAPSVYFTQFGDSALIFKVIYYVEKKDIAFRVKSELHEKIAELFRKNNVEIPFPQRDVWFRNPLKLVVKDGEAVQRKDEEL